MRDSVSNQTRWNALGKLHLKLTSAFHLYVQPYTYVNLYIHKHMHMNIREKKDYNTVSVIDLLEEAIHL